MNIDGNMEGEQHGNELLNMDSSNLVSLLQQNGCQPSETILLPILINFLNNTIAVIQLPLPYDLSSHDTPITDLKKKFIANYEEVLFVFFLFAKLISLYFF